MVAVSAMAGGAAAAPEAPRFGDYPAGAPYTGRNAAPVLATQEVRRFRTMIRNGAREKPNFASHFIVASWGCGTDCELGAIIDARSGRVVMLPVVAGLPEDAGTESGHFEYHLDSRLLVMNGMIREEPPMGSHYFVFDGQRLTPLKSVVKAEKHWGEPADAKQR